MARNQTQGKNGNTVEPNEDGSVNANIANAEVPVTTPDKQVTVIKNDFDASGANSIAAGANEKVRFTASTGFIANVANAYINVPAPAGATTGDHQIWIKHPNSQSAPIKFSSAFNEPLVLSGVYIKNASQWQTPGTQEGVIGALKSIFFDDTDGVNIAYFNNTDVAQEGILELEIVANESN
jgi:hypothetical protein